MNALISGQRDRIQHWYPAVVAAVLSTLLFVIVGETPLLRAAALSIVIGGVVLSLRRLGLVYAVGGGLALALTPAYWSQTGNVPTINPWLVLAFIGVAGAIAAALLAYSRRLFVSVAIGVSLFVGLYVLVGITQKSLRLTSILAAWLIYLTIIALRQTNPRPEDPPAKPLSQRHVNGMLLMLVLGVLNEPLFALFTPALILGLWLSNTQLPLWYWLGILLVTLLGGLRVWVTYLPMEMSIRVAGQSVPYIVWDAWQDPQRWLYLTQFVAQQFGIVGIVLGVIGIARLSRWYPTLGIVLIAIYTAYGLFGLTYFGADAPILLLPMLIIHVICATYAVYSLVDWLRRSIPMFNATSEAQSVFWRPSPK